MLTGCHGHRFHVPIADQVNDEVPLRFVVLDDKQILHLPVDEAFNAFQTGRECFVAGVPLKECKGSKIQGPLPLLFIGNDLNRNVPGCQIALEAVKDRPAFTCGFECDRVGVELAGKSDGILGTRCDDALEARVPGDFQDVLRHFGIGFYDEQHSVTVVDHIPVVGDRRRRALFPLKRLRRHWGFRRGGALAGLTRFAPDVSRGCRGFALAGQIQRKCASLVGLAGHPYLSTQQVCELAADGKSKSRSTVLAARGSIGLLERFKDNPMLVRRNPDSRVNHGERDHLVCVVQHAVAGGPAFFRGLDPERHTAFMRKLERIRQEIPQDLLKSLLIREHCFRRVLENLHFQSQPFVLRDRLEILFDVLSKIVDRNTPVLELHRARLDLCQVQNLVDQCQQLVARRMDGLRIFNLFRCQVAFLVVRKQPRKDQHAVEWRAELVRHVGQEFRLVLGGQCKLGCLFFQRSASLLDLGILAFHFLVLLEQQSRFFFKLLVRLLQLFLLRFQSLFRFLERFRLLLKLEVGFSQLRLP